MIGWFALGLRTVVAGSARAGRDTGVRKARAAPGHRRIVTLCAWRRGRNMIGRLDRRRATAARRMADLTLARRAFEDARRMARRALRLLVCAGKRKARCRVIEIRATFGGVYTRSEKSGKQHQDDEPQRAACATGHDVFVKIFHNIYLSSCFVTSIGE